MGGVRCRELSFWPPPERDQCAHEGWSVAAAGDAAVIALKDPECA